MSTSHPIAVRVGLTVALAWVVSAVGGVAVAQVPEPSTSVPAGNPAGGVARMIGTPGGLHPIVVLMAPAVQEELKLTEPQKTQVFELAREASRKSRELYQSAFRSGNFNAQALMAAGARMRQENERASNQILNPDQRERINQIMLRVEGPLAVARPEIAEKLGLTSEQHQQVRVTLMQMMMAQREILQGGAGNPEGLTGQGVDAPMRTAAGRIREAASQQIGRILNSKQKAAFNKMLGDPFDVAKIDPELARSTPAAAAGSPSGSSSAPKVDKSRARRKRATGAEKDTSTEAKKGQP
jgi:hypothetical protein